jgi:hypothetical protein
MRVQEFGYGMSANQVIPYTCKTEGIKGVLTYWRRLGLDKLEPGDKLILPCVYQGAAGEVLESNYRDKKGMANPEEAKDAHGEIKFILYDSYSARILIEQSSKD